MIQEHHKPIIEMLNVINTKLQEGFSISISSCKNTSSLLNMYPSNIDILGYFEHINKPTPTELSLFSIYYSGQIMEVVGYKQIQYGSDSIYYKFNL